MYERRIKDKKFKAILSGCNKYLQMYEISPDVRNARKYLQMYERRLKDNMYERQYVWKTILSFIICLSYIWRYLLPFIHLEIFLVFRTSGDVLRTSGDISYIWRYLLPFMCLWYIWRYSLSFVHLEIFITLRQNSLKFLVFHTSFIHLGIFIHL